MVEEAKTEFNHMLKSRADTEAWLTENQIQFQVSRQHGKA